MGIKDCVYTLMILISGIQIGCIIAWVLGREKAMDWAINSIYAQAVLTALALAVRNY